MPGNKRLREENDYLRTKVAVLEKKERQLQLLNTNLKRECDARIARLKRECDATIADLEREREPGAPKLIKLEGGSSLEVKYRSEIKQLGATVHELGLKLNEKRQAATLMHQKILAAQAEIKDLRFKLTLMEAEKREQRRR
jgi:hypothetical protein